MTSGNPATPDDESLDIELSDEEFEKISGGLRALKNLQLNNKRLLNSKSITIKTVKGRKIKMDEGMMYNGAYIPGG